MKGEIKALTGLRGIAALWVVLGHFKEVFYTLSPKFSVLDPIMLTCNQGVDIFFVLSGFILAYVYHDSLEEGRFSKKNYFIKRVARIYPNHFITLVGLLILVFGAGLLGVQMNGMYRVREFLLHTFLLHAYPVGAAGFWNNPSWSISAEFFAYIFIFPVCVFLMPYYKMVGKFLWIVPFLLTALAAYLRTQLSWEWWILPRVSLEFLAGFSLYLSWRSSATYRRISSLILPYFTVGMICALYLFFDHLNALRFFLILGTPLVIGGLASTGNILSKALAVKPIRYLGLISYAIYMTHGVFLKILAGVFPAERLGQLPDLVTVTIGGGLIIIVCVIGAITYHFWEEPARRWIQKCFN